jgi:hypothetical protein
LKGLIFFGKCDLAFGINLPERSEIWKTFLGPLMALTVDTLLAAVRALHLHCRRIVFTSTTLKDSDTNERYYGRSVVTTPEDHPLPDSWRAQLTRTFTVDDTQHPIVAIGRTGNS